MPYSMGTWRTGEECDIRLGFGGGEKSNCGRSFLVVNVAAVPFQLLSQLS
jgi:hypothetical protein